MSWLGWRPCGAALVGLALGMTGAASEAGAAPLGVGAPSSMYLVQLDAPPLAGFPGLQPRTGARLDPRAPAVRHYLRYLDAHRRAVLRRVPDVDPVYAYRWTVDGFAAALTADEVAVLRRTPGVLSVTPDGVHSLDVVQPAGPDDFLGLPGPGGAWNTLGGAPDQAGAGVVIGLIDSGIWPESASFAGARPATPRFTGHCITFRCGGAVVGARWFLKGLGAATPVRKEFRSPRDYDGHGTYVAAVAAGDAGVPAAVGPHLSPTLGTVAGVAPAAGVAAYKACWAVDGGESCAESDTVAAIDQAVADGVDVLNISISGAASGSPATDPLAAALKGAAAAGVFVAASAGNDGPDDDTANGQPWLTTVAASTFDRRPVAVVRLGDGTRLSGAGVGEGVPSRPLIAGADAGQPRAAKGADVRGGVRPDARQCDTGSLDPARVRGRIVLCVRGGSSRLAKSAEVARAGGVAMILANPGPDDLDADLHSVPTAHVDSDAYAKLTAYLKHAGATAALEPARARVTSADADRPEVAEFSARGPDGDVLAPDLMAPGVEVPAAVSPARDGSRFALRSGTSVAAPQVAGAAALLRARFPRWTPMAVKSALLTTAMTRDANGTPITTVDSEVAGPSEYGAGALAVGRAADPGLVFDSAPATWTHTSDANSPAVAIGALAGIRTVRRTVTNVGTATASYVARVEPPPGVDVDVRPSRLTVAPGKTASFTVTVRQVSAPYDQLAAGSITWTDGQHTVRMPVAVKPVVLTAPAVAAGRMRIVPGFSGRLRARLSGPVPAVGHTTWLRRTGAPARFSAATPRASDRAARFTVTITRGTALARFATPISDYPSGTDVDLYVYRGGASVGRSTGHDAGERVDLHSPKAGTYQVFVRLVTAPGSGPLPVRMDSYAVPARAATKAAIRPGNRGVLAGTPALVRLDWPGRPKSGRWLAQIEWSDGGTGDATTTLSGY